MSLQNARADSVTTIQQWPWLTSYRSLVSTDKDKWNENNFCTHIQVKQEVMETHAIICAVWFCIFWIILTFCKITLTYNLDVIVWHKISPSEHTSNDLVHSLASHRDVLNTENQTYCGQSANWLTTNHVTNYTIKECNTATNDSNYYVTLTIEYA